MDCSASLGNNDFRTQTECVKEFVISLHVGEDNVRVGYAPYNTDVYQSFDLEQYDTTDSVLLGIGKLPLRGYPPIIEEEGGSEEVEHDS